MKFRIKEVCFEGVKGATSTYYIQRRVWFWWVDQYEVVDDSNPYSCTPTYKERVSFRNLEDARQYVKDAEAEARKIGVTPKISRKVTIHHVE